MSIKEIYHYNKKGRLISKSELDDEIFNKLPRNSTDIEPPETNDNETVRFDADNEEWQVLADYRGQKFKDSDDEIHIIEELEVEPEDDWEPYEEDTGPTLKKRVTELEESLAQIVGGE